MSAEVGSLVIPALVSGALVFLLYPRARRWRSSWVERRDARRRAEQRLELERVVARINAAPLGVANNRAALEDVARSHPKYTAAAEHLMALRECMYVATHTTSRSEMLARVGIAHYSQRQAFAALPIALTEAELQQHRAGLEVLASQAKARIDALETQEARAVVEEATEGEEAPTLVEWFETILLLAEREQRSYEIFARREFGEVSISDANGKTMMRMHRYAQAIIERRGK